MGLMSCFLMSKRFRCVLYWLLWDDLFNNFNTRPMVGTTHALNPLDMLATSNYYLNKAVIIPKAIYCAGVWKIKKNEGKTEKQQNNCSRSNKKLQEDTAKSNASYTNAHTYLQTYLFLIYIYLCVCMRVCVCKNTQIY